MEKIEAKLDQIMKVLKGVQTQQSTLNDDFQRLERKLAGFEKSMDFINSQFEDHKKITDTLLKRNTKL